MKKLIIIFTLFLSFIGNAQTYKFYQTDNINNQLRLNTKTGEVYQIQNDGKIFVVHSPTNHDIEIANRYALYKTKNMWTYILLDKFSGKLWQCQYSIDGIEHILSVVINPDELSGTTTNKFTIRPMTSMYQFYLINDETGEMWQFQWSTKGVDFRWIKKM